MKKSVTLFLVSFFIFISTPGNSMSTATIRTRLNNANVTSTTTTATTTTTSSTTIPSNPIPASPATPPLHPIVISARYGVPYSNTTNTTLEFVFLYKEVNETSSEGARIQVTSDANHDFPLIVVVRQKRGILSWQIPLLVERLNFDTLTFDTTSRTLCSTKYYRTDYDSIGQEEFVTVSISTASHTNISFNLTISQVHDFYIELGKNRTVEISPSEPIYYGYIFSDQSDSSSVIVRVESESDVCMTVSIQNASCPVFDLERNVQYSKYWQTVSRKGGITVPKEHFRTGFFVVLVVKGDDTDCKGTPTAIKPRNKTVVLSIQASITKHDYLLASAIVTSAFVAFFLAYIIGTVVSRVREARALNFSMLNNAEPQEDYREPLPSPSTDEVGPSQYASIEDDSSLDEDDIDMLEDALHDKEVIRTKRVLSVCDLARKDPKILRHKSRLYLYYLATISIFYTLPVVQLVVTYQQVLHETGNQDLCYYNFLCSHPLGLLSDFNHVYSNFAYLLLGLLFIFLTYSREHSETDEERNKAYGIPQHYGLFYAMGGALMMEGILSGCYHVCPNHSNFQFDTSFMYIIAVLCMVKIYQTRHPDINARAPVTFGVLAVIIFLGMFGVLDGSVYFWIAFTIIHLLVCLLLTVQIYYMGRLRFNRGLMRRVIMTLNNDARAGLRHLLRPLYAGRLILLIIVNLCNVALSIYGNLHHEKDFATYLLALLMSNLILYTFFYIVIKLCYGERILLRPLIYIILSCATWAAALYFFINKTISWALTPAQSRMNNRPCVLLNFFDFHDIWHFLSALAMFFSFMVLLTLDDDLVDVHRSQIPVF